MSGRSSGSRIDAKSFSAPADLADIVEVFWAGSWDLPPDEPHTTRLLGDPCAHVVFERSATHSGGRVVGVWTGQWTRMLEGEGRVRGVKLRAGAVRSLFALEAHEMSNLVVPFTDHFDDAADLQIQVLDDDLEHAFEGFANWLGDHRRDGERADVSLAIALMHRIDQDLSITSVADLTEVAGMSERQLQRLFRVHVGATPKWALMRRRIQEATVRLEAGDFESIAELAASLHYADQAHFTRDFKRLVEQTPTQFAAAVWA